MANDPQQEDRELYGQATAEDLKKALSDRGLPTSGNKPDLVDRLLADDAEQEAAKGTLSINEARTARGLPPIDVPDEDGSDPENPEPEDGELCAACWPGGWPSKDTNNASCEHGVWDR